MSSERTGLGAYRLLYDLIRKTPLLNHLAHKVMQSEAVHRFPPYRLLYKTLIWRKANQCFWRPPVLEITVTDMCNSSCIMCPPPVHTGNTIMEQELFEQLCREARDLGIHKMVITGGEPLLDKRIFAKIRYAKAYGFDYIHMFTNASLLTEDKSRELIESGLDSLTWSIDSADKDEYERIRRGLKFDHVIKNINRFMEIRNQFGVTKPLTRVNMVCLPENLQSREKFRRFFGSFVDIVEIIDSHNFAGSACEISSDSALEYTQKTRYPCHILFYKLVIAPDGTVRKCSIDYSRHGNIESAKKKSLRKILSSSHLVDIKNMHLRYDFSEPGCDICTHKESWWVNY